MGHFIQLLRDAKNQSSNVIVDLQRTEMAMDKALDQVDQPLQRYDELEQVTVISQDKQEVVRRRVD
ncbi:CdiA C-terminal domain-containing protein [Corynebacterium propinquum]|uniref:tRNA nuclease CdiA C-terminal domain-containing protein n=2 Tax=Corynebacterium propinquum TaxID=43769 RepID=A0AAP4BUG0_9CORY|nr:hypothetical protein [Corynebacterium propinquum]MCG7231754.1 hypothetical protein [Corynebacterium propinquum]MDK4302845.1 hypothetical protein [Corynebacterium propinquum]MDK4325716.1 hypothetical protein [Corynebacterium propinquum]MDK8536047.1 hypothetical protein [Corynebacterium propinquum]UQV61146.1 hypothetical protein L9H28_04870 [Corynebacterium propinquum]